MVEINFLHIWQFFLVFLSFDVVVWFLARRGVPASLLSSQPKFPSLHAGVRGGGHETTP